MRQIWMAVAAGLLSWGLTGLVLAVARRRQHLAPPTDRGLHTVATPVGGGLGLIGAALILWVLNAWPLTTGMIEIAAGMAMLAAV